MPKFTHFDERGNSQMVDVGDKPVSARSAQAMALIDCQQGTISAIQKMDVSKGNVLEVARLAGIMGCKQTSNLIPLCHPLPLDKVSIEFELLNENLIRISSTVKTQGRTGVEMEALTACSIAALTIYDMCKSMDRTMTIRSIQLMEKHGGKSGDFVRKSQED